MELFRIFYLLLLNFFVTGSNISQTKCDKYRNAVVSNEIVDADAARQFPLLVTVTHCNTNIIQSGILISENFVLSTASCLPSSLVVKLTNFKAETITKTYEVIDTFQHPDFNAQDLDFNIKLFKLNESISNYVRPACLPTQDLAVPNNVKQIGWNYSTDHLYQIDSNVISKESCKTLYESADSSKFVSHIENGNILCARPKKGEQQLCKDYIGSALIDADSSAIIGFALYNLKCDGNSTNIFVRVSAFTHWIESIVWRDEIHLKVATDNAKPDVPDYIILSNKTTQISDSEASVTTKLQISDRGKNFTEIPEIRYLSYLSEDDVKFSKTDPEKVDNAKNNDTTQPNLFVGDIKSNASELTELMETPDMKHNATNQEVSGDAIDSNTTTIFVNLDGNKFTIIEPAIPDSAIKFNTTTTPKMLDAATKSNATEQYPPDNKLKSEETGHYLTLTVALISFVLCASCVYLMKDKLKKCRKVQSPYSCVYAHFGEHSVLIESNVQL